MYELLVDNGGMAEPNEAATVWVAMPSTEEAGELEKVWVRLYPGRCAAGGGEPGACARVVEAAPEVVAQAHGRTEGRAQGGARAGRGGREETLATQVRVRNEGTGPKGETPRGRRAAGDNGVQEGAHGASAR